MMIMIGLILSFSILFFCHWDCRLRKSGNLGSYEAFGYTDRECQGHILAPYRFWTI